MGHRQVADSKSAGKSDQITIKKYANRRLYNTATSSYVTLDHLCQMVKDGVDFVVYDAKSGEDITRTVLTQIIVEEEAKGANLLPINFLRQLITFYGDNMEWVVPRYLEHMMTSFAENQDRMRKSMQDAFGGMFPFGNLEEMNKQNRALFENAMRMLTPFGVPGSDEAQEKSENAVPPTPNGSATAGDPKTLSDLQQQVDQLQRQLEALSTQEKKDG